MTFTNIFINLLFLNSQSYLISAPDEDRSSPEESQYPKNGNNTGETELPANNLGTDISTTDCSTIPPSVNCKDMAELMQQNYLPNIPLVRAKNTLEMNVFNNKAPSDTIVEKVGVVKYIGSDLNCESSNPGQPRNCSTLSEKSSDSGVSSSSLSSANHNTAKIKQRRNASKAALIESPTRSYVTQYLAERKD